MDEKVINVNETITNDEIKIVYDKLEEDNQSKELLEKAHEITENTEYNEIEPIEDINIDEAFDIEDDSELEDVLNEDGTVNSDKDLYDEESFDKLIDENIPQKTVKKAMVESGLNISESEATKVLSLLTAYKKDKNIKIYDRLPGTLKGYVTNLQNSLPKVRDNYGNTRKPSKEMLAKYFLDNFLTEASINNLFNEMEKQISEETNKANRELKDLFEQAYSELFDKVENLENEDPEKVEHLKKFKEAFDKAKTFDKQLEYLKNDKPRNARKYAIRYSDAVIEFNKLVSTAEIKIASLDSLFDVIKLRLPQYTNDQIKAFLVLLGRSVKDIDYSDMVQVAYVYRLIDNIFKFKYITTAYDGEGAKETFDGISAVIEAIETHKKGGN